MSNLFPDDLGQLDIWDRTGGPNRLESPSQPRRAVDVIREQEAQMHREGRRVFYAAVGVLIGVMGLLGAAIVGAL